jgi:hypothetical protein
MERSERLRLFVKELTEAAPATNDEEARSLLEEILNSVEDQHSGVEYNPDAWQDDGRMYAPKDDSEKKSPYDGVRVFRTRGHRILLGGNGAIKIVSAKFALGSPEAEIILDKPGFDGRCCP